MGGFLRRLFSPRSGAGEAPRADEVVEYQGYTITPAPERESGAWSARSRRATAPSGGSITSPAPTLRPIVTPSSR